MALTYRDIAEILEALETSDCEELIIETGGSRLIYRKHAVGSGNRAEAHPQQVLGAGRSEREAPLANSSAASSTAVAQETSDGLHIVRAPCLGTFYRSPSPNELPFVEPDSVVELDDPLCLIEVMKLYNTIGAPIGGRIRRVFVEDASLVEFDQPLFLIEPVSTAGS